MSDIENGKRVRNISTGEKGSVDPDNLTDADLNTIIEAATKYHERKFLSI